MHLLQRYVPSMSNRSKRNDRRMLSNVQNVSVIPLSHSKDSSEADDIQMKNSGAFCSLQWRSIVIGREENQFALFVARSRLFDGWNERRKNNNNEINRRSTCKKQLLTVRTIVFVRWRANEGAREKKKREKILFTFDFLFVLQDILFLFSSST